MKSSRPYVQLDPAVIEQARQMDLLSYLRAYEPNNLVRVGGSVYCTREHDSLKISNGKWYWWSRGIGGVSALDYLIKVKDYGFVEAVEALTGGAVEWTPPQTPKKDEPKVLLLPPKNKDCSRVMQYLFGRGMLNQASTDRIELAKLLNISDLQLSYITNVGAGQGLLKVGSSLVPFVNKFPRNTELYKLMTTKFGEV